jgi:NAD(P)H-dependent FMN reductase
MDHRLHLTIIIGSTREGRFGPRVANWFATVVREHGAFDLDVIDLVEADLPATLTSEPSPAVEAYCARLARADAFAIVTPEYNHGYPAALKSALDHAYEEWNRKPVAFVSYGGHAAGYRAVEQLRQVAIELQMVPLREQVGIQFPWMAFDAQGDLTREGAEAAVGRMVDDLLWWTRALRHARAAELTPV